MLDFLITPEKRMSSGAVALLTQLPVAVCAWGGNTCCSVQAVGGTASSS